MATEAPTAPRCTARNELRGLRCDRPAGHAGAHIQDDDWAQIGWGFDLSKPVISDE